MMMMTSNKQTLQEINEVSIYLWSGWKFSEKKNSRTPTALFIGSLLLYIYLFNSYIHISFSLRHTRTKHSMLYIKKGFSSSVPVSITVWDLQTTFWSAYTLCTHTHIWTHHKQLHMALCLDLIYSQQTSTESVTNLEINQRQSSECGLFWQIPKHCVRFAEKSDVSL